MQRQEEQEQVQEPTVCRLASGGGADLVALRDRLSAMLELDGLLQRR